MRQAQRMRLVEQARGIILPEMDDFHSGNQAEDAGVARFAATAMIDLV